MQQDHYAASVHANRTYFIPSYGRVVMKYCSGHDTRKTAWLITATSVKKSVVQYHAMQRGK